MSTGRQQDIRVAIIVGEESGDQLGAGLMCALDALVAQELPKARVRYIGTSGPRMSANGLTSLFPLSDIAVMGLGPVIKRLPQIMRRLREATQAVIAAQPHCLVIIDSPDFTQRLAKRVHRALPNVPIINYVGPSVWAWRPWRARAMRAYVDHVMAILPFESAAFSRLKGPPCTYVGHPVITRHRDYTPNPGERRDLDAKASVKPRLVVLPGSRTSEIRRLLPVFAETLVKLQCMGVFFEAVIPAVDHLADEIAAAVAHWPVPVEIVRGEREKWAVFRHAHGALAASGTVTLELAMAGVPMVVAYKLGALERSLKWLASVDTMVLTNLILEQRIVPEFLDQDCTPTALAQALAPLLDLTPQRDAQIEAFRRLRKDMRIKAKTPSALAARIVFDHIGKENVYNGVHGTIAKCV